MENTLLLSVGLESAGHCGLVGELVGPVGHLLATLQLAEVPLGEHQIPQHSGGPEEVERDDETEGPGSVGELLVDNNGLDLIHPKEPSSDLSRREPAANNVEEDAEDQHDQEPYQPEVEAGEEVGEVLPSILHSVAGLDNLLLDGHGLEVNILSEVRINTEFCAETLVAYRDDFVRHDLALLVEMRIEDSSKTWCEF